MYVPPQILEAGGGALDAVVACVAALEENPRFNAGAQGWRGSRQLGRGRASPSLPLGGSD
jgi:isoaspartyl peptidase/L-asparaginase-like protein (Ntn-hydrolase superfamily)